MKKPNKNINKSNYLTYLSVISCIAVVYLHSNFVVWENVYTRYFITSNIIRSIFYFAVPIFFMITGATLLDYKEKYSTREFFIRRIKKTFFPFIIWSVFAIFFKVSIKQINLEDLTFLSIINGIILTKYNDIYWYFIFLFKIYLVIPLFSSLNKKDKKNILKYLAGVMLILNVIFPFINNIFSLNFAQPLTIFFDNGYLLYVILGYLIHNCDLNRKRRFLIYLFGIISLLLMIIGGCYVSIKSGIFSELFHEYLGLPCMIYSISIFVFFKYNFNFFSKINIVNSLCSILSKYTFSIYLIHMYIIHLLVNMFNLNIYSIFYRTLFPIPIIITCIFFIYLLRKINILKFVLPE